MNLNEIEKNINDREHVYKLFFDDRIGSLCTCDRIMLYV